MSGPTLAYAAEPRTARLGASEVAAVLGFSPWQTPFQVWARKIGLPEAPETRVTRRGRYLESAVLRWLRDETDAVELVEAGGYDTPWVVHPRGRWPHVGCHPDGYLLQDVGEEFADGSCAPDIRWHGAEGKTARTDRGWGDGADAVPPDYWLQCQVGMALTILPAWDLGVYVPMSEAFRAYRLDPDDETARESLDRAEAWYVRHVLGDEPPPVDGSDDARRWLLSRFPSGHAPLRDATDAEAVLVAEVARARADLRALTAHEKTLSARLCEAIGDADGLTLPDGSRATWRAQTARRLDIERLRAERPDVAEAYTAGTATRVLRVPKETA